MLGKVVACKVTDSIGTLGQITLLSVVFPEISVIAFWTGPDTEVSAIMQYTGHFEALGEAQFPFEFAYRAWEYAMAGEELQTHREVIGQVLSELICDPERANGEWTEARIVSWLDDGRECNGIRLDTGGILCYQGEGYDACVLRIDPALTILTEGAHVLIPTATAKAATDYEFACERLQWVRRPLDVIMRDALKAHLNISVDQAAPA